MFKIRTVSGVGWDGKEGEVPQAGRGGNKMAGNVFLAERSGHFELYLLKSVDGKGGNI